jgi:hypothetical protein
MVDELRGSVSIQGRFYPGLKVRHAEVDGLRVILDLSAETYKVLDDRASAMWSVLIGQFDRVTVFEDLMRQYDVGAARLSADFASFATRCVEMGLLEKTVDPTSRTTPLFCAIKTSGRLLPRSIRALYCMVATQRALDRDGFNKTYERYALFSWDVPPAKLDETLSAFAKAENLFIARCAPNDCLVRSLSLFRFLKSENIAAEHVIGVKRVPFEAHAWVECGGEPVLDDRVKGFTPLSRIGLVTA